MEKIHSIFTVLLISLVLQSCVTSPGKPVNEDRAAESRQQLTQALEYFRDQQFSEAKLAVSKSLENNPGNAQAHHIAGLIFQRGGQTSQAREHFNAAIDLAPDNAGIRNNYGNFLCATGNYAAANRNFSLAAKQPDNTQPAIAYTNAGLCAIRSGKNDQARRSFEQAVQIDPAQTSALFQLARLNLDIGKPLAASTLLEQYSQHERHTSKTLLLLAKIEQALGNKANMEQYKQRLVNEFPNSNETRESKSLITTGNRGQNSVVSPSPEASSVLTDTDWLLSRNPNHYTLQILALEDEAAVKRTLIDTPLQSVAHHYSFRSNGKTWFNVIVGDYPDINSARRELQSLPASLQKLNPWIRRFDSIQRVISQKGE